MIKNASNFDVHVFVLHQTFLGVVYKLCLGLTEKGVMDFVTIILCTKKRDDVGRESKIVQHYVTSFMNDTSASY